MDETSRLLGELITEVKNLKQQQADMAASLRDMQAKYNQFVGGRTVAMVVAGGIGGAVMFVIKHTAGWLS